MLADAVALAAALACAVPDGPPPAIEIRPASLLLGSGETARVVVRSPAGAPRLAASAGTLGPAREVSPGVFEAVLEPPAEAYPQLAIVAALAPSGVAFAALPLVGRGTAIAHTEPHAWITVEIRGRAFGPALADDAGVARVPVVVPPGVSFALHRGKSLDLRVPPLRQALVVVDPPVLRADREQIATVYAFGAAPEGGPWADAPIALSASEGRLGPGRPIAPGAVAAEWVVPPGRAGTLAVEARVPAGPPGIAEVPRAAGPPARVGIRLGADHLAAGEPPVDVVVDVEDAAGNPTRGDVELAASFGDLSAATIGEDGALRASLRVPERLGGRAEAVLEARIGEAVARRAVALAPAAAERVAITLERRELTADGREGCDVAVSVADRFGNGVDDPAPRVEAGRGRILGASRVAPGEYRARYTAAWLRDEGDDAVVARAGDLVASAPVRLRAAPRQLAAALRTGVVHARGGFTAPLVGAGVEEWPAALGGAFGLALGVARLGASRAEQAALGGSLHGVAATSAQWPIEATALARRPLLPALAAFAGAGVRAVAVHATVSLDGQRAASEWGWALGAHAQAGISYEVPSWHARARLDALAAWQGDPGMRSYRGSLLLWGLAVGVVHDAL